MHLRQRRPRHEPDEAGFIVHTASVGSGPGQDPSIGARTWEHCSWSVELRAIGDEPWFAVLGDSHDKPDAEVWLNSIEAVFAAAAAINQAGVWLVTQAGQR